MPIVFITAHGDIPMSVKAMKKGAVGLLVKPFDEENLLKAVQEALKDDVVDRGAMKENNAYFNGLNCSPLANTKF